MSTTAFNLHNTLSTNARSKLQHAVQLDEANKYPAALAAYQQAATLLNTYLTAFAPTSKGFEQLSVVEKPIVTNTRAALSRHLQSLRGRLQSISNPRPKLVRAQTQRLPQRNYSQALVLASQPTAPPQLSQPSNALVPVNQPAQRYQSKIPKNDPLRISIESEILDNSPSVSWDDIYGLEDAKNALHEMVVLPAQRPDLYCGLRAPGRGVLLFGPPGTGKTMVAKAVASNANSTFFSISASSLNSKFHGESERLVRALFEIARERQPAFIFFDEVDSILGSRSDNEHEASRRLKTEFMAQFDGAGGAADRVYVMAASNRPQDLDDAVRRRLDRRIYVGLPSKTGRKEFLKQVTKKNNNVKWNISDEDFEALATKTVRFSGSDIKALCREASLMPLRELGTRVSDVHASEVRACTMKDFREALLIVRASSDAEVLKELEDWDAKFGSRPHSGRKPGGSSASGNGPSNGPGTQPAARGGTSRTSGGDRSSAVRGGVTTRSQAARSQGQKKNNNGALTRSSTLSWKWWPSE